MRSILFNRWAQILLCTLLFYWLAGAGEFSFGFDVFSTVKNFSYFITHFLYLWLLFYLLSLYRPIYFTFVPLLFVCTTAATYYTHEFGIRVDSYLISAIYVAEQREAEEIISTAFLVRLAVSILISGLLIGLYQISYKKGKNALQKKYTRGAAYSLFLLVIISSVLVRWYHYPAHFLIKSFQPPVLNVPTEPHMADVLAKYFWGDLQHYDSTTNYHKGRQQYEMHHSVNKNRIRLHASTGYYSVKSHYIKRTYDRFGNLLKVKFYWPEKLKPYLLNEFEPFYLFGEIWKAINHLVNAFEVEVLDISRFESTADPELTEDLIVVVIIGEAARSDHFELNGYRRNTNPLLLKESNLVSFSQTQSCSASSYISVPCMLTRMETNNLPENYLNSETKAYIYQPLTAENTFISLFRKHGFATNWHSINRSFGSRDAPISRLLPDAEVLTFVDGYHDGRLLPGFEDRIDKIKGRQLIVMHTLGSHWKYASRYPKAYRRYEPECKASIPSQCKQDELVNAYDNAILYTDFFIDSVIEKLKGQKAIMLFVADHGESLGEQGFYTHSVMSRKEQRHVPMFWWISEQLDDQAPKILKNLQKNAHKETSHDHLFHSILDCSGIQSKVIDVNSSLCREIDIPLKDGLPVAGQQQCTENCLNEPPSRELTCESFENGYASGSDLSDHRGWHSSNSDHGIHIMNDTGVGKSMGLAPGDRAFTWKSQPFSWRDKDLEVVHIQMDYQTDSLGRFDDDRLGWTISDNEDSSNNIFGVQLDPGGRRAGGNIEAYWDGDTLGDDGGRTSIVDLPDLLKDSWYRLRLSITKLTELSARIDVSLYKLDDDGKITGQIASGSIPDTSKLANTPGNKSPNSAYFTSPVLWPVFKNYDVVEGSVDNSCFGVVKKSEISTQN